MLLVLISYLLLMFYFLDNKTTVPLYMFVISERQEGLHASLNISGSETAFHGEEEQSTTSVSSTGTQQYTECSVMADNWGKKFTVWSHGICLIQGGGEQQPHHIHSKTLCRIHFS